MRVLLALPTLFLATQASASVLSASDNGFEVQQTVNLVVPQSEAYNSFGRIGQWWNSEHSYSGDASRMTLPLRAGSCFCETLDNGGGIEHMRVTFVQPGDRVLMTGGLGPLLYEATAGVMDVKFERIAGGTRVTMNYRVAGFAKGGAAAMAPLVDQVLGDQMKRYRTFAAAAPKTDTLKP